jgi:hypothetical protein
MGFNLVHVFNALQEAGEDPVRPSPDARAIAAAIALLLGTAGHKTPCYNNEKR